MSKCPDIKYYSVIPFRAIAFILSYAIWGSILWGLLAALFGGWYVIYWLFQYTEFREWVLSFTY
jgi:hypothetical protein